MKLIRILALLLTLLTSMLLACSADDPLPDDIYTKHIYPAENTAYDLGSEALAYQKGYFDSVYIDGTENPWEQKGARVYNSTGQTIPNDTATIVTFDSERYDTDGIHSTVSNTSRLTCVTAGKYVILANFKWDTNGTGYRQAGIYLNGTTYLGLVRGYPSDLHNFFSSPVTAVWDLAVNDYVEARVYQDSGGNLDILVAGNYSFEFMMQRIGD